MQYCVQVYLIIKMIKKIFILAFISCSLAAAAQEEEEERKGFKKENLFSGGSISLSFFNQSFLIGANPVFGYSIAKWADAGVVVNYTYTSYRDYNVFDDRLRQTIYGGGVFARLFPVRFLFAQGQIEHNWIKLKYMPPNNGMTQEQSVNGTSILVGGGYCTGRDPDNKNTFGYLAVLFDISDNENSPYMDNASRPIPIIRAGLQIPLFQR